MSKLILLILWELVYHSNLNLRKVTGNAATTFLKFAYSIEQKTRVT